jgi:hypothetical protein
VTFLQALKDGGYLHPVYGVVANAPHSGARFEETGSVCDNYFLFSAVAMKVAATRLEATALRVIRDSLITFADACEMEPGLYRRFPGIDGSTSWDELIGAAYASWGLARSILAQGEKTDWAFNQESPGTWSWRAWFPRNIAFVAFIRAASGLQVGQFNQILWALKAITTAFGPKEEVSGRQLIWLMSSTMASYPLSAIGASLFQSICKLKYPGGPQEMLGIYYRVNHPIAQFAPGKR